MRLTEFETGISSFAWSPDSTRLALVARDPDPDTADASDEDKRKPRPIVIRRLQFKQDGVGYLTEQRDQVHVFDIGTKTSVRITSGPWDSRSPAWSPDGTRLVFVSNRTDEPDANFNTDLFIVEAREGAAPLKVTSWPGSDTAPAFSPDGRHIAYLQGGDPEDIWYTTNHVAVIPVEGGEPRVLTHGLDRNVSEPRFSADGRHVLFLLEDGGHRHLARLPAGGGALERVVAGERDILAFDIGGRDRIAALETQPHYPAEISAWTAAR